MISLECKHCGKELHYAPEQRHIHAKWPKQSFKGSLYMVIGKWCYPKTSRGYQACFAGSECPKICLGYWEDHPEEAAAIDKKMKEAWRGWGRW